MGACASRGRGDAAHEHAASAPAAAVEQEGDAPETLQEPQSVAPESPRTSLPAQAPATEAAAPAQVVAQVAAPAAAAAAVGGATDGRKLVMLIWDVENVRLPLNTAPGLSPQDVVKHLKKNFISDRGRTEWRTVAAVTQRSLPRMLQNHPRLVEELVQEVTLIMASAVDSKRNADVVLKKEVQQFVAEHSHTTRAHPGQHTVVLISGDEDFLGPVQDAMKAGFNVELVTHDTASGALLSLGYSRPPVLWSNFLRECSGVQDVVLPYGDEQLYNVLRPSSIIVAGFGPRRNGYVDERGLVQRLLPAEARAGLQIEVLQPSFGEFSGSGVVLLSTQHAPDPREQAALAQLLRQRAGAGVAGSDLRLVVIEAGRMLRLVLQASDDWVPGQDAAAMRLNGHAQEGNDSLQPAAPGTNSSLYNATSGRTLLARIADAAGRLTALLRAYRVPSSSPQRQQAPYGTAQGTQLLVLCRFASVPGQGQRALTLLVAAADPHADLLVAMSFLRGAADELRKAHGVELAVDRMFSGTGSGQHGPSNGPRGAGQAGPYPSFEPHEAQRRRLPTLEHAQPQGVASAAALQQTTAAQQQPVSQQQQQQLAAANQSAHAGGPAGDAPADSDSSDSEGQPGRQPLQGQTQQQGKKKRKKRNRRRNKNKVHPL